MSNSNSRVPPHRASEGWLTRGQVAELLGVSISKVRAMEAGGELVPITEDGVHLFDRPQIESLKPPTPAAPPGGPPLTSPGEITAACFELFKKGQRVTEICISLKLPVDKVRALHREWRAGDSEPAPVLDDQELEASERKWRSEMDRVYSAWEKEMDAKWHPKRRAK